MALPESGRNLHTLSLPRNMNLPVGNAPGAHGFIPTRVRIHLHIEKRPITGRHSPCTSTPRYESRSPWPESVRKPVRLERIGFDALWSVETRHDPFFPLLRRARDRLAPGRTNIAVAFARTPFSMAHSAWDLQAASRGRLLLGLGTQVRPHVERRFSAEFEHPAARIVDYIDCLRAVWNTFQTGARPAHDGPMRAASTASP